jgi:elongation factor Ts
MFRFAQRPATFFCQRAYSTSPPKIPISLVAELRKKTQVSINKAREALTHSNGDVDGALEWLRKDMITTGVSKAAKVASRETKEGLVGVSVLSSGAGLTTAGGVRAAMVELNCETDFVGRNELFAKLAQDIAHTAAFISEAKQGDVSFVELSLDELKESPLLSHADPSATPSGTVASAIRDTIVKVGENITLGRASAIVEDAPVAPSPSTHNALRLGSYIHGALRGLSTGRVGTLALLNLQSTRLSKVIAESQFREDLVNLERSLARQIVGFDTLSIKPAPENEVEEQALYKQPFITLAGELNGQLVGEVLGQWSSSHGLSSEGVEGGVEVLSFLKWRVGETP